MAELRQTMNRLLTPDEFAADVLKSMTKAEDEAGIPRGSIAKAFVEEFNSQFSVPTMTKHRENPYTVADCDSWIALLEMFSDDHVLLHGAAGENAMDVCDVLHAFRQLRAALHQEEK